MFFHIQAENGVPVYEQIARQIMFAIASGGIVQGEMVPSVRVLAREMTVNPNTVARAYRQLQDAGVLETVRGSGLLVSQTAEKTCRHERVRLVGERIRGVLTEARQSSLTENEIKQLITDGLKATAADQRDQTKGQP